MTNPNVQYYISSGAKNAMRTLRRLTTGGPFNTYKDEYICNLARDFDVAMEKAKGIAGNNPVMGDAFDLNDWGEGWTPKKWEKEAVAAIKGGVMPFGKHKGADIEDLGNNEGYVKYWVQQTAQNVPASHLIQAFTDIANNRGYFQKWEDEEKAKEAAEEEKRRNSKHIGEVRQRLVLDIKCLKVLSFEGYYGRSYFNICETRDGAAVIYKGANAWEKDVCYTVKATIKEHDEYKGVKQTVITRPNIIKTIGKKEVADG